MMDNKLVIFALGVIVGVIVVPHVRAAIANRMGGTNSSTK